MKPRFPKGTYRAELIQVAAVALAMLQVELRDSTERASPESRDTEEGLLVEIQAERARQEKKWGTRIGSDDSRLWWYAVLGEENGEVGKALLERKI